MKLTQEKALKKVEIAIDKMVDLQMEYNDPDGIIQHKTERILDLLRDLESYVDLGY